MKAGGTTIRPIVLPGRGRILFQSLAKVPKPSQGCHNGGTTMLDINLIREQPDVVRKSLRDRQMDATPVDSILELDEKRRALLTEAETLKAERNAVSKEIGQMKDKSARQSKIDTMRAVGDKISAMDVELAEVDAELQALMSGLPNSCIANRT